MSANKNLLPLQSLFKAAGLPGYLLFSANILYFFVTRRRELNDYAAIDDSAIFQIIFILTVFLISLYLLLKEPQKIKFLFLSPQIFLFLYITICFVSMLWTPNLFLTGFRAFESLTYIILISLVAYNLVTKVSLQDTIEWAILWVVWDIFWSIALEVKFSGFAYLIWPFNSSRLVVPIFFFFALLLSKRNYFKYIILAFSILSVSNKVFFGIALGLIGFFYGDSKAKGWLFLIVIPLLVTLLFVDIEEILLNTLFYGRESVSMTQTSGRDKIWGIAWNAFLQKPLIGYGFVSGENLVLYDKFKGGAINTHSFLFSSLLGTGITGTLCLLLYFWTAFKKASSIYFPLSKFRPAMVSTVIMSLVVSSVAPGVGGRVYGSWVPVVLAFTIISALQYKFETIYKVKNIQKTVNHENNMGGAFFS